ncbi:ABC transporter ATP-binding protein [Pseudorhodoferax sp.]|uniref:ABC transporter ATP-binding protein n=1 Tax=Pseudorhodoferax sp. TaxID=1993553 RepID=UPI002DD6202D|nr:ABC transporter ATP-binding protein [Pseudorhodoferax sp.]
MNLLNVTGLTKRYGGLAAVDGVDLAIERGQIVGLIGPNGAGKSTFVELLTGGVPPTSGRIAFDGQDVTRLPAHGRCRLGIARTFQVPQPFYGSSVFENVTTAALFGNGRLQRSLKEGQQIARETLFRVGLSPLADRSPTELTTAGLKRLEVARCLATDAKMMLLDEPLGGLNQTEVNDAVNLIRSVQQAGVTILFIEHIIPAVLELCDRVVVLANGRKLAEGSGQEVVSNPVVQKAYLGDVSGAAKRRRNRREAEGASA